MYSLIIAEDEFTTRRALVNIVRWKELGFCVDGEFSNGQDVLNYLKNNTPDVILTDIKMPGVSGIEIAKLIAEKNLPIQVVFLSAYRDFFYAQEALEYRVVHYLVKPVDLTKLREIFRGLKERLDEQAKKDKVLRESADHYNRLVDYEKQQFVTDTYFGALVSPEQIRRRLRLIDTGFRGAYTPLVLVKIVICNDLQYEEFLSNYGQQELQEQLVNILKYFDERLEYYAITCNFTQDGELSMLGVFWENREITPLLNNPERLKETICKLMRLQVQIPIFRQLESPEQLAHCTEASLKESEDELIQDVEYLQLLQGQNQLLHSYLCDGNAEQGQELSGAIFSNYLKGGMVFARRRCIYTITKLLDEVAGDDLVEWNSMYAQCLSPASFSITRPETMKEWFLDCVKRLFDFAGDQSETKRNTSIEKIMNYMHEHYREDITLSSIAEEVFLNPAYISRLIKEKTGKNYIDIVMEMRIDRAVELLENTSTYVYEIAKEVGYDNLKYFYKVFRKVKGKSPGDYRPAAK